VAGSLVAVAVGGTGVSVGAWLVSPTGVNVLVGVVVGSSADLLQAARENRVNMKIPISKRRCKVIVKPLEKMGLKNSISTVFAQQFQSTGGGRAPHKDQCNSRSASVQIKPRRTYWSVAFTTICARGSRPIVSEIGDNRKTCGLN
jgi:hypothetical protein